MVGTVLRKPSVTAPRALRIGTLYWFYLCKLIRNG